MAPSAERSARAAASAAARSPRLAPSPRKTRAWGRWDTDASGGPARGIRRGRRDAPARADELAAEAQLARGELFEAAERAEKDRGRRREREGDEVPAGLTVVDPGTHENAPAAEEHARERQAAIAARRRDPERDPRGRTRRAEAEALEAVDERIAAGAQAGARGVERAVDRRERRRDRARGR